MTRGTATRGGSPARSWCGVADLRASLAPVSGRPPYPLSRDAETCSRQFVSLRRGGPATQRVAAIDRMRRARRHTRAGNAALERP